MKLAVSKLGGVLLNKALALCPVPPGEGAEWKHSYRFWFSQTQDGPPLYVCDDGTWRLVSFGSRTARRFSPSTDWTQGGPIIDREGINLNKRDGEWKAEAFPAEGGVAIGLGPTPLIAAMRALVASKLGEQVELP